MWRARLERWFTPLARRTPLSPNSISIIAAVFALAGAAAFALARANPLLFLIGVAIVAVAGLLDAFDGIVARAQSKESRFGDFLDHFLDRVSDLAILSGWLIGAEVNTALALASLAAVALVGYIGTQIEASFGKRSYEGAGRGEFVLALIAFPIISYTVRRGELGEDLVFSIDDILASLLFVFTLAPLAGRLVLARRLSDEEKR